MTETEKQMRLKRIPHEANLRVILMNLLGQMGLEPVLTHGSLEKADIVCKESNKFGKVEWIGFVAKLGKITGATSGTGSLQTILNQVLEAFIHPHKDEKTKTQVFLNKVYVVTNEEILNTAREKLIEKVAALQSTVRANVHFMVGAELIPLLDAHWPDFWQTRHLTVSDPMSADVGKILYVVALAHTHHSRQAKRKPAELSEIVIGRHTGLDEGTIKFGLDYLLERQYLEKTTDQQFILHRALTASRLLMTTGHIRLLDLLSEKANSVRHLSLKEAVDVAKKAGFAPSFVKISLRLLLRGDYILQDKSRGKDHYSISDGVLEDERKYLDCWLTYKGKLPEGGNQ